MIDFGGTINIFKTSFVDPECHHVLVSSPCTVEFECVCPTATCALRLFFVDVSNSTCLLYTCDRYAAGALIAVVADIATPEIAVFGTALVALVAGSLVGLLVKEQQA